MSTFSERIALAITADTGGAVQPLGQFTKASREAESAWDKMGRRVGVSGESLRRGLASLGSLALGAGLVEGARRMMEGYAEAAKAAGDLAAATGGSVQEVSAMQAALVDAGISADKSATLLTKFTTAASTKRGATALADLNVELVRGATGAVDYAATMVKAVDSITQIGDAATRNEQLVALFGKAGAQAFQDLMNSGLSLQDAMDAIDTGRIFTPQDIANAAAYDDAMDSLAASGQAFGNTVGRTLVPVLNDLLAVVTPIVDALAAMDSGTLLVGGAAVALALNQGRVVAAVGAANTAMRALGNAAIKPLIVDYTGLTVAAGASAAAISGSATAAKGATTAGLVSGLTKGVVGLTIAWEVYSRAIQGAEDDLAQFGATNREITDEAVRAYNDSLSAFERWGLNVRDFATNWTNFIPVVGPARGIGKLWNELFGDGDLDQRREELQRYQAETRAAAEAQGGYAVAALEAKEAQDALNRMLADGGYSAQALSQAVNDVAAAQAEKNRVDAQAKDLLDAAADSTWRAVDATLAQIDLEFALKAASDATAEAIKKKGSNVDEVAQAALREANAAAKLAEQTAQLAGETFTAADAHDALIASLEKQLDDRDLTRAERKSLQDLIDRLRDAQAAAGEGIEIGGIRWKEGTTETQIAALKAQIDDAFRHGDINLARQLQDQLDALRLPDITQTVHIVGPDGKPLGSDGVDVPVNVTGVPAAQAQIASIAKPQTVDLNVRAAGWFAVDAQLKGLAAARDVVMTPMVKGDKAKADLDELAKRRTVVLEAQLVGDDDVRRALNALDDDRYVTIHVTYSRTNAVPPGLAGGDRTVPAAAATAAAATPIYVQAVDPMVTARQIQASLEGYAVSVGRPPMTARPAAW